MSLQVSGSSKRDLEQGFDSAWRARKLTCWWSDDIIGTTMQLGDLLHDDAALWYVKNIVLVQLLLAAFASQAIWHKQEKGSCFQPADAAGIES